MRWRSITACFLIVATAAAQRAAGEVPPLTEEERIALQSAYDGRGHEEPAFAALVDHLETWSRPVGDVMTRTSPDFDAMLDHPENYRGDFCVVTGQLVQRTRLSPPWSAMEEWFIRVAGGRPVIVFVRPEDGTSAERFREGRQVRVLARFYKVVDDVDRGGNARRYPALVGRFAHTVATGGAASWPMWIVIVPVAVLLAAFIGLMISIRRQRRRRPMVIGRPSGAAAAAEEVDEGGPLPDDPALALAELRRRAEEE